MELDEKPEKEEKDDKREGSRAMDPELRIMGQMLRQLDELEDDARGRVVRYLSSRYPV